MHDHLVKRHHVSSYLRNGQVVSGYNRGAHMAANPQAGAALATAVVGGAKLVGIAAGAVLLKGLAIGALAVGAVSLLGAIFGQQESELDRVRRQVAALESQLADARLTMLLGIVLGGLSIAGVVFDWASWINWCLAIFGGLTAFAGVSGYREKQPELAAAEAYLQRLQTGR